MTYKITLKPRAAKNFSKLPPKVQRVIAARIDSLSENPYPPDVKKLRDTQNLYSIRGKKKYRIVFQIDNNNHELLIVVIDDRSKAYSDL
jgi:mRNA-degrading endonuclease RelE of RelBE toxin-antitoxin system